MAISTISATGLDSAVSQTGKNLIHNGEMAVSQRPLPITGLGASSSYTFDRWKYENSGSPTGRHTISRGTGILNAASSLRIDVTTADSSLASNALYQMTQKIEAQNLHFLEFGSATAKAFTISFTMKSNFDGAFTLHLIAPDGSRNYATPINLVGDESQETFEITIPGDTSGAFTFDNGVGLDTMITLSAGSGFAGGTQNAWAASNNNMYGASNSGNFFSSTDNYVEFSLFQLEVGSVATDFEHEPVSVTMAKCQRYFIRITGEEDNDSVAFYGSTDTDRGTSFFHTVPMRASPTASLGGTVPNMPDCAGTITSINAAQDDHEHQIQMIHWVVSSATDNQVSRLRFATADTDFIQFTAEI